MVPEVIQQDVESPTFCFRPRLWRRVSFEGFRGLRGLRAQGFYALAVDEGVCFLRG